ncbi:hypothetical protein G4B88_030543 [Cannabis sativa]|uniref:CCHC-type domain-containing protein n=1 Tax=Cannabis sativa TaxID=3483 RepID=A0A7J6EKJ5_CANSA|nr:hypothetical protein G4B88_030543 [Cannabis sativa]
MHPMPDLAMEDLLDRTGKLRVKDEDGWEIDEEKESEVGKSCLLGRFCSNKNMNRNLIRTILGRIWGLDEVDWGVKIKKATTDATFMIFSFKNEADLARIEKRSPWLLNNGVLILQKFSKLPTKWEEELKCFPLTGRVLNLPTKSITRNNMLRLASMAGDVIEIQKEEVTRITMNGFFWFKVWVSIENPLCPGFLFPNCGAKIWLPFRYERLPYMCFSCGRIGHDFRTCEKHPVTISDGNGCSSPAYGAWMKVEDKPMGLKERKAITEERGNEVFRNRTTDRVAGGDECRKTFEGISIGEVQKIDQIPNITNRNSINTKVSNSKLSIPFDFSNLLGSFKDKRVEKDFEKNSGSGLKRRADFWEMLNKEEGMGSEPGKRLHREGIGEIVDSGLHINKEGEEWIDIPITMGKELGGEVLNQKGGRKKRVVAKRNKKVDTKLKAPIIASNEDLAESSRWRVEEGSRVRVNEDRWIPRGAPFTLRTPALVPPNTYVNTLLDDSGNWRIESLEKIMHKDDIPWVVGIQTRSDRGEDALIEETIGHALWKCPRLKVVWQTAGFWHLFPRDIEFMTDLLEFFIYMKTKCSTEEFETFLGLSWLVWNQRNQRIFQNKKTDFESWIPWAIDYTKSLLQRDINTKNQQTIHGKRSWKAPTAGTFMVNCDASVVSNLQGYSLAAVIRNAEGKLVAAEVKFKSGFVSVIMAELLAVKLGLLLVQKMQAKPFLKYAS